MIKETPTIEVLVDCSICERRGWKECPMVEITVNRSGAASCDATYSDGYCAQFVLDRRIDPRNQKRRC